MSIERLESLADLLTAGRTPAEALALMERLGAGPGVWARGLAASVRAGASLGMALSQDGAVSAAELVRLGGVEAAGTGSALRQICRWRRTRRARRRALLAPLALPVLFAVTTTILARVVLSMFGAGGSGSVLGDLMPLIVLLGCIWVGVNRPDWTIGHLRKLKLLSRFTEPADTAFFARAVADGLDDRRGAQWAFQSAARLVTAPGLRRVATDVAQRLGGGRSLLDALPSGVQAGEALGLCLLTGAASGDLPRRLHAFADAHEETFLRLARFAVRVLVWFAAYWAMTHAMSGIMDIEFNSMGLGGSLQLDPGATQDMEQLMRELDL